MKDFNNENILHVKAENGIEYLQFKKLNEYGITNAIFLRHGGISEGIYSSLNLRLSSKDNIQNVYYNIAKICEVLNVNESNICKAYQNHTNNVIYINSENMEQFYYMKQNTTQADAYITNEKGIVTMITTADCVPLIIYDPDNNVIANVHSGWKGTLKQVYIKVLNKMVKEFNTKLQNVIICMGPAIGKCCFTSKEKSFKNKFTEIWKNEKDYIEKDSDDTYHIDLKYVIKQDVLAQGVLPRNIYDAPICTKCNSADFYSYRRTTCNKEEDYATFGTFVGIN